ncbi:MAG: hypothetical protein P8123_00735 [bacterium]
MIERSPWWDTNQKRVGVVAAALFKETGIRRTELQQAIIDRDEYAVWRIVAGLEIGEKRSLVSLIEELLLLSVMQIGLRYDIFHSSKVQLLLTV